jgi:NitT/TauT family transport system permease protein
VSQERSTVGGGSSSRDPQSAKRGSRFPTPPLLLARALVVVGFLALLEVIVQAGLIRKFFLPPPSEFLVQVARDLVNVEFLTLTGITLYETMAAFLLAAAVGVTFGFLLWRFNLIGTALDPLVAGLFSSPVVLLYPVFLVIFGRTPSAIISLASLFGVLPIILFTRQALAGVSPTFLRVGRSMKLSSWSNFRHILLPAAAPTIFTGLRIGLTYILIVVVAMEFVLQIGGLGNLVAESSLLFRANELYSAVTLVIVVSAAFLYLINRVEKMVK